MSSLQLTGHVAEGELERLRRQYQQMDGALREIRNELGQVKLERDQALEVVKRLRNILAPLYSTLRLMFGEMEMVYSESITPSGSANGGKWDFVKQRLSPRLREAIDILMLQGPMRRTQLAAAMHMDYSNCTKNVIGILMRQGLLVEDGKLVKLKEL
jgi:hypothetical protein